MGGPALRAMTTFQLFAHGLAKRLKSLLCLCLCCLVLAGTVDWCLWVGDGAGDLVWKDDWHGQNQGFPGNHESRRDYEKSRQIVPTGPAATAILKAPKGTD